MDDIDEQGRPLPPLAGTEEETLLGYLDFQRATLAWKCGGVDAAGLAATTAASTMTLGGLLKHMALVEEHWFSGSLHGRELGEPWSSVDWKSDPDWDWRTGATDAPDQVRSQWEQAVARSRADLAQALATGDLGQPAKRTWSDGRAPSLRWIIVHMLEEYARHNGHADLLREAHDGGAIGE